MSGFVPWNSQPLSKWVSRYAPGKIIELDGLSTHYIEKGAGEPVILLHGFFFDSNMWNENIDALAQNYKVYAIDLWGFGYSTREPLDYGYPLYTQQLLKFMNALDIQKASLVGQSMGGGTIINFTISHRNRIDKIVLVNAAGLPNTLPLIGRISNLPKLGEFMYGLNSNYIRKFTLGNNFIHNKEILTAEFFENITRFHKIKGTSEVMLYVTRKQFFDTLHDEIKVLGLMHVPILIMWGRDEKTIPLSIGKKLHKLLNGSRLEILDRAGHCSNIDQHQIFNRLTIEFLSSDASSM
jgi:pimeloyl-ACP methyl ester carboxylesterase